MPNLLNRLIGFGDVGMFRQAFTALALGLALGSATLHAALPISDSQGKELPTLAPMLERVNPAVVNIATFSTRRVGVNPLLNDPFFQRFFNLPRQQMQPQQRRAQNSAGSGVIVDASEGTIVTNFHVIKGADEIQISLTDGRSYEATLIGADPEVDIAVLDIDAQSLTQLDLRDSDEVRVGDFVVAIGNPFGLGQTITTGVVSALGRSGLGIEGYENFIQTDASINPGNSGGALVDLNGNLVGINTAIIAPGGGNVGIGFAIPANMMRQVADQILDQGGVSRGQIGISIQEVTPDLQRAFQMRNGESGVLVTGVSADSPAEQAGIEPGDVILSVDGKATPDIGQLRNRIAFAPDDRMVPVLVLRDGQRVELSVRVSHSLTQQSNEDLHPLLEGARFQNSADGRGVLVSGLAPDSRAAAAGLQIEDRLLSVNRQRINNVEALSEMLAGRRGELLLQIQRDRSVFYLVLR